MTALPGIHVLCEGYNDRDFLAEYLERSGWEAQRQTKSSSIFGNIAPGRFLFSRRSSPQQLLLTQCGGVRKIAHLAASLVKLRKTKPLALLLVDDADGIVDAETAAEEPLPKLLFELADILGEERPTSCTAELLGVRCAAVSWASAHEKAPGLPDQQTLERVIAAAFRERDSTSAAGVEKWLRDDEPPGESGPKAYAHSYFAKWLTQSMSTDFYRAVWREDALARPLREGVDACGLTERLAYLEADSAEP